MTPSAPVLVGQCTRLRPLDAQDVPLLARWLFDPEVNRWLQLSEDPPEYRTIQAVRERFEGMHGDPRCRLWLIETRDGEAIGHLDMVEIHSLQRRAEIHISIGSAESRGKGYGSDAIRTVVRYAFGEMGLRRLFLVVDEDNAAAIRCYEAAGFKREGILREHRTRYGEPVNMLMMGAVAEKQNQKEDN